MQEISGLLPFQKCTAVWVLKQLRVKDRSPRRFLVADEVGLGKTKIAARVIEGLAEMQKNLVVVYVSSSLDISHQNRKKLCKEPDRQVVHADRVCLLYDDERRNIARRSGGLRIVSLTPTTSLNLDRGSGNISERAYIARYLTRRFHIPGETLISRLKGQAGRGVFAFEYDQTKYKAVMPPARVCDAIDRAWLKAGLISKLRSRMTKSSEVGKLVSGLRMEMAKAILEKLQPDLVILDEVQKYPDVIATDGDAKLEHPVAKGLLGNAVPTLVLSATPYRAFVGSAQIRDGEEHLEDLKKIFLFLTGSNTRTKELIEQLGKYNEAVRTIKDESLTDVLKHKRKLETDLLQYMSRAERVNFESGQNLPYVERSLQEEINTDPAGKFAISDKQLREWVKLKGIVRSKRAYLHLWRSGHSVLSYMHPEYKVFAALGKRNSRLRRGDGSLYTRPGELDLHPKLQYLKKDLLAEGEIGKYLWIPPICPYYEGGGIYSMDTLKTRPVKKGLVFSSWSFVPRFVAAELSAWQTQRQSRKQIKHPLKENVINWARFWHPSPWLASMILHHDFRSGSHRYDDLHKMAKERITQALKDSGWQIGRGSEQTWEVLYTMDVGPNKHWANELRYHFKRPRNEFSRRYTERGGAMPTAEIERLNTCSTGKTVSRTVLAELATIALTSPAVCLLRSLYSMPIPVLPSGMVDGHTMAILSDFCARNWKTFFNREATARAIASNYSGKLSYAEKLQRYCRDGNIQAMLDEYIYHLQPGTGARAYKDILHKLAVVVGPKGGKLSVRVGQHRRPKRVTVEQITLFGKSDELTQSRSSIREAFNSPFWPFILVTTSVGQEGLDFHLYCKDIYHWNLPSNPIDFEQREGRINRYNSFWVRGVIAKSVTLMPTEKSEFYWNSLYKLAPMHADRNDRFNLGMSPHWTFTPAKVISDKGYFRHILAIPGTDEWPRYRMLMEDLTHYRLTLGRPNQVEFMKHLKENTFLRRNDTRVVTLCLFPYDHKFIREQLKREYLSEQSKRQLIRDAKDHLNTLRGDKQYKSLFTQVMRHIRIVMRENSKRETAESIGALLYFVNPHDDIHDRTPIVGLRDDLKKLININRERKMRVPASAFDRNPGREERG